MQECGFSLTRILLYKDKTGRIRVTENPYPRIFYAVKGTSFNNLSSNLKHRKLCRTEANVDFK